MALSCSIRALAATLALGWVALPSRRCRVVCGLYREARDDILTFIGDYIKVTCDTSTLTHYFVVHSGDPIIHMATYITAGMSKPTYLFSQRTHDNLRAVDR